MSFQISVHRVYQQQQPIIAYHESWLIRLDSIWVFLQMNKQKINTFSMPYCTQSTNFLFCFVLFCFVLNQSIHQSISILIYRCTNIAYTIAVQYVHRTPKSGFRIERHTIDDDDVSVDKIMFVARVVGWLSAPRHNSTIIKAPWYTVQENNIE